MKEIIKFELKKIFSSWVVWGLMAIVVAFNGMLIVTQSLPRNELAIITEMISEHGSAINNETLTQWHFEHQYWIDQMNEITERKMRETFNSVEALVDELRNRFVDISDIFETDEEWQIIRTTDIIEGYYFTARDADSVQRQIRLVEFGEQIVEDAELTGALAETIIKQFEANQYRLDRLIENGEHLHFFFNNGFFEVHTILFRRVFGAITAGITVLVVVVAAFLFSYEFDHKTNLLVYTTKCGRTLQMAKLKAAMFATSVMMFIITSSTLGIYFVVFDYSGLWHIPISSVFMSDSWRLIISAYPLTFFQYLLAVIAMIYIGQVLFTLLTFTLSKLIRNGYLTTVLFFVLFALGMVVPRVDLFANHSMLPFYLGFNPFFLLFRDLRGSFLIGLISESYQHFELVTLCVWMVIFLLGTTWCYHQFKKIDL